MATVPETARKAAPVDPVTVEVIAHLDGPVVLPVFWPAPLDGLLAGEARRRAGIRTVATPSRAQLEADPRGQRDAEVRAYRRMFSIQPIGITPAQLGSAGPWIWLATAAEPKQWPDDVLEIAERWRSQRAEVSRRGSVRVPTARIETPTLRWRAIGDPDAIFDLADAIDEVGEAGAGRVAEWTVGVLGPRDTHGVLRDRDGFVSRPVPHHRKVLAKLGLDPEVEWVEHQVRPPYFRAPIGNDGRRQSPKVIAPWVSMPTA